VPLGTMDAPALLVSMPPRGVPRVPLYRGTGRDGHEDRAAAREALRWHRRYNGFPYIPNGRRTRAARRSRSCRVIAIAIVDCLQDAANRGCCPNSRLLSQFEFRSVLSSLFAKMSQRSNVGAALLPKERAAFCASVALYEVWRSLGETGGACHERLGNIQRSAAACRRACVRRAGSGQARQCGAACRKELG
jgi:hypothetical protein